MVCFHPCIEAKLALEYVHFVISFEPLSGINGIHLREAAPMLELLYRHEGDPLGHLATLIAKEPDSQVGLGNQLCLTHVSASILVGG